MVEPTDCIAKDFSSGWFKKWADEIGFPPAKHAKFWEVSIIAEALSERGCLAPGKTGLGMGVGNEQLVSLFAKRGVAVTATDQDPAEEKAQKWDNGQLASGLGDLLYTDIVEPAVFSKLARYEAYDMNSYAKKYVGKFDFVWHNCVVGHLGSMEASMKQLERSAKYLKEGGWLVFTTELNISNFDVTVDRDSDTIIWRLKDTKMMFKKLAECGLETSGLQLRMGNLPEDTRINYNHITEPLKMASILSDPEYSEIKIPFSNYAATQVLLCFRKTTIKKALKSAKRYSKKQYKNNKKIILEHQKANQDLADYNADRQAVDISTVQLLPTKRTYSLSIPAGETKTLEVFYTNTSNLKVFDYSQVTPRGVSPLVVATDEPMNRPSQFYSSKWSSPNRPALDFMAVANTDLELKSPSWNTHRCEPGGRLKYLVELRAPTQTGRYTEKFKLILEGLGEVGSSEITVVVDVTAVPTTSATTKAYPRGTSITPEEFFQAIKWQSRYPDLPDVPVVFSDWLRVLGRENFTVRLSIGVDEFLVFLKTYLEDNSYKLDDFAGLEAEALRSHSIRIKINEPVAEPEELAPVVLILANPRSGNNAIGETLSRVTGWDKQSSPVGFIDFNAIEKPTIILYHVTRQNFLTEFKAHNPYRVVTIKRHPFDVLLSAFRFNQKSASGIHWLHGSVFPTPYYGKDKNPLSKEFIDWAMGDGGGAVLSSTVSWVNDANATIRYEDYIDDPQATTKKLLDDLSVKYNAADTKRAVTDIKDNYLIGSHNQHRWSSDKYNWPKFMSRETAEALYKYHQPVFEALGYDIKVDKYLTKSEIRKNISKLW